MWKFLIRLKKWLKNKLSKNGSGSNIIFYRSAVFYRFLSLSLIEFNHFRTTALDPWSYPLGGRHLHTSHAISRTGWFFDSTTFFASPRRRAAVAVIRFGTLLWHDTNVCYARYYWHWILYLLLYHQQRSHEIVSRRFWIYRWSALYLRIILSSVLGEIVNNIPQYVIWISFP